MNFESIKYNSYSYFFSILLSILLHAIIIIAAIFILNFTADNSTVKNSYVQIITNQIENNEEEKTSPKEISKPDPAPLKEKLDEKKNDEEIVEKNKPVTKDEKLNSYLNFSETNLDTTNLNQIYKEPTLNVSIRYPKGWTFIDQNVKSKLDGVTFWSVSGKYNTPPYIHLEVKEKYLFNESRYAYKKTEKNYTIFYNEPVELAGQITQILYIRTADEEDFSIKLIMNNAESFKSFQPEFFGMVKTFKFGKSYF